QPAQRLRRHSQAHERRIRRPGRQPAGPRSADRAGRRNRAAERGVAAQSPRRVRAERWHGTCIRAALMAARLSPQAAEEAGPAPDSAARPLVLITGAAGNLGRSLAAAFAERYTVVGMDRGPNEPAD